MKEHPSFRRESDAGIQVSEGANFESVTTGTQSSRDCCSAFSVLAVVK
jgi:hypothetical protein